MQLIPVEMAEKLAAFSRREGMWRGVVYGVFAGFVFAILMVAAFTVKAQTIPREAYEYRRDIIRHGRAVWGLDAPTAAFAAQIHQESGFRENARSGVGALGIAQFMPSTQRWIQGAFPEELAGNPLSPEWGIRALVRYNKYLWDRIPVYADICERLAFTYSGYNGGIGWTLKRQRLSDRPGQCLGATCDINPGITAANQRENSGYSRRILLHLEPIYTAAGFGPGACWK